MSLPRPLGLITGLIALVLGTAAAAAEFPTETLRSVVSVLPDWPGHPRDEGAPKTPEGSAVAMFPGGWLVTNVHVLGRAKTARVRLHDGRVLPVEIKARDVPTDLALLKVDAELPVLETAPQPALGAPVCAVGNQFGLGLSVTCGVVSAVHRSGTGFNPVEDFIQTDATINPGGSGGALVDASGRLVGVVSAIFTKESDADIGVNFATDVALVHRIAEDLRTHGRVLRARSGLRVGRLSDAERRRTAGAKVLNVTAGGPAEAAGLRPDDVIVRIAGRQIRKPSDVTSAFAHFRRGDRVAVRTLRAGAPQDHTVTLAK